MSDLHPVFVRAKEILLTQGWYRGAARGPKGEPCLIMACCDASEDIYDDNVLDDMNTLRIHGTLQKVIGAPDIPRWNDYPTRTLEEVIAALDKAIILTAPVVEFAGVS